jgi:uncharacterized protein YceK
MLKMLLTFAVTCVLASGCASTQSAPKSSPATAADTPANADCSKTMVTGSRIPQNGCAPGQVYTQEDLQRTGHQDTSKALESADPAVQIHH